MNISLLKNTWKYGRDTNMEPLKCPSSMNNTTERKFHPMSIEDREMFAYNSYREKQQAEIARINAHPEQRMKYCLSFMEGADDETRTKCYNLIAEYSAQLDYSEAHF